MATQFVQKVIQKQVYKKLILNVLYGCCVGRVGSILSVQRVECLWDSHINLFFVSGARFSLLVNLTTTALNLHKSYSIEREESSEVWDEKELQFLYALSNKLCVGTRDDYQKPQAG